jgi:hypothetical protein
MQLFQKIKKKYIAYPQENFLFTILLGVTRRLNANLKKKLKNVLKTPQFLYESLEKGFNLEPLKFNKLRFRNNTAQQIKYCSLSEKCKGAETARPGCWQSPESAR